MHNKKIRWTLLLSAALLAGCGKQIPKDVIHPDKMEDILYDYHLTTAMSGNISYDENYKKEALRNYVYRKHHVTKAEFDSSMVWYTRHTENLAKIYTNLGKEGCETLAGNARKQTLNVTTWRYSRCVV